MPDPLASLPRFYWRGKAYPVARRDVSFQHENASHKIEYRDGELIEQTGARNITLRFTLPMYENIAKGPYKELFSAGYYELFNDVRNREPGDLIDPQLGPLKCVPTSFSGDLDATKRDGSEVTVEFVHFIEPGEDFLFISQVSAQGAHADAGALDEQLEGADWQQAESPEPTQDPLNVISGAGAQLQANANKVNAALEDFAFKCEKVEDQVDAAENPDLWPLKRAARRNRFVAKQLLKRGQDPTRTVAQVINNHQRGLSSVAAEVGMSVQDLIKLNPAFARSPAVPAGASVNIYKKK